MRRIWVGNECAVYDTTKYGHSDRHCLIRCIQEHYLCAPKMSFSESLIV